MVISFRNRLFLGFSVAIALSTVSGITSYSIFQKQARQRQWVRSTSHLLDSVKLIQSLVIDMETGRRGFRSTNDKKFLEPYNAAITHINPLLDGVVDSLANNAADQEKAIALRQLVENLLVFWQSNGVDA